MAETTQITLENGLEVEIFPNALNDMEVIDLIIEADEGGQELLVYSKLMKKLMPLESKQKIYDFIRLEDGTVPPDAFTPIILELFHAIDPKKK